MSTKSGKKGGKGARKSPPQSISGIQHTPNRFDALLAEDDAASPAETIPTCLQTAYNILRDEKNCLEDAREAYRTAIKQLGFNNANDLILIKASPSELDSIYCITTKGRILLKQALDVYFAKSEDQTEPNLLIQARKLAPDFRNSGLPDQAGRPSSHSSCALSFHGEEDDIFSTESITSNVTGGQSTLRNGKGSYISTVYRKQQPLELTSKTAAARERHLKLLSTTLIEHVGGSLRGSPSTIQFANLLAGTASKEGLPLMDVLKAVHTLKLTTSSKKERLEITQLLGPPEAVSHENRRGLEAYSQLVSRHPWSQSIAQVLKHLSYQKTLLKGSLFTFSPSRIECWKDHIDEFGVLVTSKIHLAMTSHPDDSTARQGHIVMRALFLKMIYVLISNAFANDDPSVLGGDNFDHQWRAHVERPSKFVYPTEFSVVEWESCLKLSGFSCPKPNCGLLGFTEGFCTYQETVSIKKDGLEARRKEAKDKLYSLPSTQALDQKDRGAAFNRAHGHLNDNSKTHSPKSKEEILTTMFKNQGSIKLPYNITP
jgi:hypothetical protein